MNFGDRSTVHLRARENLDLSGVKALKHPLNKSIESCREVLKHRIMRCGRKYRFLKIEVSLQHCHLRVIIDLEINDTTDSGGRGAFVHTFLSKESKSSNLSGLTTRKADNSLRLSLIANSAASSYCFPIIRSRRYFARTVAHSNASWPSLESPMSETLYRHIISVVVIALALSAKVPI